MSSETMHVGRTVTNGPHLILKDIRQASRARGHHWFDAGAMEGFGTRLHGPVIAGRFFITSEQASHDEDRRFTIRMARDDGRVVSVGGFRLYATHPEAHVALLAGIRAGISVLPPDDDERRGWIVTLGVIVIDGMTTQPAAYELAAEISAEGSEGGR